MTRRGIVCLTVVVLLLATASAHQTPNGRRGKVVLLAASTAHQAADGRRGMVVGTWTAEGPFEWPTSRMTTTHTFNPDGSAVTVARYIAEGGVTTRTSTGTWDLRGGALSLTYTGDVFDYAERPPDGREVVSGVPSLSGRTVHTRLASVSDTHLVLRGSTLPRDRPDGTPTWTLERVR